MIPRDRRIFALFAGVALLHLLPVVRAPLIPTEDGPSHVYNAMVLRELAKGTPEFTRVFAVNRHLNPNWLGHLVLMYSSEKVLVSVIVLLFLAGCWRLGGGWAFLAMPLAYHLLLQMGFYNYSLGLSLCLLAIASWWRSERIWISSAWMFFAALSHPVPAAAAVVFIGVLWLMTDRNWRRLTPLIVPALIIGFFLLEPERPGGTWTWKGALLLQPLLRVMLAFTSEPRQIVFGTVLGVIYAVLIVATIAVDGWKARAPFAILTLVAVAMYLGAPVSEQEGPVLKARLLIFPFVLVLPWLSPRLLRTPLVLALALVAAGNVFYIQKCWKRNEKAMLRMLSPIEAVQPGRTVVALIGDAATPNSSLPLLLHAVSYAAERHRLVDLGNYEASLTFFPVVFRPEVRRPPVYSLEVETATVNVPAYAPDYIYTWKVQRTFDGYDVIASEGEARLYARRLQTQPAR